MKIVSFCILLPLLLHGQHSLSDFVSVDFKIICIHKLTLIGCFELTLFTVAFWYALCLVPKWESRAVIKLQVKMRKIMQSATMLIHHACAVMVFCLSSMEAIEFCTVIS